MIAYGTDEQKAEWIDDLAEGRKGFAFGITEPDHGSDATHMETTAVRDGDEWVINGEKTWNTGIHKAQYDLIFARTSGKAGDGHGITAFLTPTKSPGFEIVEYLWTFNMPTDHAHIRLTDVRVPHSAIFGGEGKGLQVVQHFFNENRIRQAASSLGAAQFCIDQAVEYAKERKPFGKPLATNQAIQFPLVELQTQCEMLRALIHKTAWQMDTYGAFSVSDKVSMCNYWANRLCCEAADRAMQVHGGLGLLAAQAVRAHLPPPPPLPHHRGSRGDPDAARRRLHVRLHEPAGAEGRRPSERDGRVVAEPVRPRHRADHGESTTRSGRASTTPRSRRCCLRSRTSRATRRCSATDLRPDPLLCRHAAGRSHRRAGSRSRGRSRSKTLIRYRDDGCNAAPAALRRRLLQIMRVHRRRRADGRRTCRCSKRSSPTGARTAALRAGSSTSSRPASTSAC